MSKTSVLDVNIQIPPINFENNQIPINLFSPVKEVYSSLQNCRIIQKNLVYIIGLSLNLIKNEKKLKSFEYFGQYGTVTKLVINKNKVYTGLNPNQPTYSCYVTYLNEDESSLAILCLDNTTIDGHNIKASYGTTKYCLNFLRNSICLNNECLYLHKIADDKDIIYKEEMINNKNSFFHQILMAIKLSKIDSIEKKYKLSLIKNRTTYFPNAFTVYNKKFFNYFLNKNNSNTNNNSKNNNKKIYKSSNQSRFNFIDNKLDNNNSKVEVPLSIQSFVNENNNYFLSKEKDNFSNYYFSLKNDKNSWTSLINTLNVWKEVNKMGEKINNINIENLVD